MSEVNIFEKASRNKLRFQYKGSITTEDLWTLPLEELDKIYANLSDRQEKNNKRSFLRTRNTVDKLDELKLEILEYVMTTLLAEENNRKTAAEKRIKKQQLLAIIDQKKNEQLSGMSIAELTAMVEDL